MGRYPTRNGLSLSPYDLGYTKPTPEQLDKRGATQMHHLFFDKEWYQGKRHRQLFRNLTTHVLPMITPEHIDLHNRYSAPVMPSDVQMITVLDDYIAVNGVIDVVFEKHTRDSYYIEMPAWQNIKQQHKGVR